MGFRNGLEPWHIIVLLVIFVALFGYKRLPDAARSIGRSMRIFKAETKGLRGNDDEADEAPTAKAAEKVAEKVQDPEAPSQQRLADQERV